MTYYDQLAYKVKSLKFKLKLYTAIPMLSLLESWGYYNYLHLNTSLVVTNTKLTEVLRLLGYEDHMHTKVKELNYTIVSKNELFKLRQYYTNNYKGESLKDYEKY